MILKHRERLFFILLILLSILDSSAQNLVRNPNFTEIDSCPYTFGQVYFASPWRSDNDQSPDLFDSCSTISFYELPIEFSCVQITPKKDNGFIGIVSYGLLPNGNSIREVISSSFISELPSGVDIYCSIAVRPNPRCVINPDIPNFVCYANGVGLAIEYSNQSREIVFQAEEIIDNIDDWTILHGCYEAIGEETRVQIQNFSPDVFTDRDCLIEGDDSNIAYTFIDNVIVAPFDILPDTLVVCDIDAVELEDIAFYNLALSWDDGTDGGPRTFSQSGTYALMADAKKCILQEHVYVVVVDDDIFDPVQKVIKCLASDVELSIDIPGEVSWDNGTTMHNRTVTAIGTYEATVITECTTLELIFEVEEDDCSNLITAANIFSPNGDNINETITFYINSEIEVQGDFLILDRWGSVVFRRSANEELIWDGKSTSGELLEKGVYVWVFVSENSDVNQSGDITLIR